MKHRLINYLGSGSSAATGDTPRRSGAQLWSLLREYVRAGKHRTFLNDYASVSVRMRKGAILHLPEEYFFDEDDTAGDKFTKLVTQQVIKMREEKSSRPPPTQPLSASSPNFTPEQKLALQKDEEAYETAIKCLLYPLLDHAHLAADSVDELSQHPSPTFSDDASHRNSRAADHSRAIIAHLATFLAPQGDSADVAESGSPTGAGNGSTAGSRWLHRRRSEHSIKVTPAILKELRRSMKERMQAADSSRDQVMHAALIRFYDDVIKKRASFVVVSTGLTYEDLVQIFTAGVQQELKALLHHHLAPPVEEREGGSPVEQEHAQPQQSVADILAPYANAEDALNGRVQKFIELLKSAVERACLDEKVQQQQQQQHRRTGSRVRSASGAHSHHAESSPHRRQPSSAARGGNHLRAATTDADSRPRLQAPTTDTGNSDTVKAAPSLTVSLGAGLDRLGLRGMVGIGGGGGSGSGAAHADTDGVKYQSQEMHLMLEWLKEAFMVGRERHEHILHSLSSSYSVESVVQDFTERLQELEHDARIEEDSERLAALYGGAKPDSFQRFSKAGYLYWRKLEKQEMQRYIARINKLYLSTGGGGGDNSDEQLDGNTNTNNNVDSSGNAGPQLLGDASRVSVRVLVVEARNLTIKDDDGTSDPYVSISYGGQIYQTEIVPHSLQPYWSQEITLELDPRAKKGKTVKIVVWDHDDAEEKFKVTAPLSMKFWRDEADDFLGQVCFAPDELLQMLHSAPGRRIDQWFPLQKRSRRSHISGDIHLIIDIDRGRGVPQQTDDEQQGTDTMAASSLHTTTDKASTIDTATFDNRAPSVMATTIKPARFLNYQQLYKALLYKLLEYDGRMTRGQLGDGSLSKVSESILAEVGERWRLDKVWREVLYFKILCEQYRDPPAVSHVSGAQKLAAVSSGPSVATLIAAYRRAEQMVLQVKSYMSHIKVLCPQTVDVLPDGQKLINPPVISGIGDLVVSDDTVSTYVDTLAKLDELLKWQIQRYKDCFPCDTPVGALVSTLSMITMLAENEWVNSGAASGDAAAAHHRSLDSGMASDDKTSERSFAASNDALAQLIRIGTVERYMRMSELAAPMEEDQVARLIKLADLLMEEIDTDITYFQKPFAADVNVVGLTSSIYLKNFFLEMENFTGDLAVQRRSPKQHEKHAADIDKLGSRLFELLYRVQDVQRKYLPLIEDPSDSAACANLSAEFSVHKWFAPLIHDWLVVNEVKLLQWVDKALLLDKFEPMSAEAGTLHSTSVVDLFFCFAQMKECLLKLDWCAAGGMLPSYGPDATERELVFRTVSWNGILTRFGRTLMRALTKYCDALRDGVSVAVAANVKKRSAASDKAFQSFLRDAKASLMSPESPSDQHDAADSSAKTLPAPGGGGDNSDLLAATKHSCVKVNNVETARTQLNAIYDELQVRTISEYNEKHKKRAAPAASTSLESAGLTGCLTVRVVLAENVLACDTNGTSDPYCVIKAVQCPPARLPGGASNASSTGFTEGMFSAVTPAAYETRPDGTQVRVIARTRIVPATVNPRWDESFTVLLRQATKLEVSIYDWDLVGRDDVCGACTVPMDTLQRALSDMQSHDVWLDMKPQGKVLLRVQMEPMAVSPFGELSDIEFYFRKAFREMKRTVGDILAILVDSMSAVMTRDLVKIVKQAEKHGRQGLGDTSFHMKNLLLMHPSTDPSHCYAAVTDPRDQLVAAEEVDAAVQHLTDYLNEQLGTLSQFLFPRLSKELLRKSWRELVLVMDTLLLPSLYGDVVVLVPLARTRPLTERQVEMVGRVARVLRDFFHAEGSPEGLSAEQLDTEKYREVEQTVQWYWVNKQAIMQEYRRRLPLTDTPTSQGGGNKEGSADFLLKILRLRAAQNDKECRVFLEEQLRERDRRLCWNSVDSVGVDVDNKK